MTTEAPVPGPAADPGTNPKQAATTTPARRNDVQPARRIIDSAELLQHGTELQIAHDGAVYTLRLTRQNKLILTK